MDRFVRTQNVERYCRLLDRVTEESERWQIIKLLTEERQKQKEAGDFAQLLAVSEAGTGRFPFPSLVAGFEGHGGPILRTYVKLLS